MRPLLLLFLLIPLSAIAQEELTIVQPVPERSEFLDLRSKLRENDVQSIEDAIISNNFVVFSHYLHPSVKTNKVKTIFDDIQQKLEGRVWELITHYSGEASLSVVARGYAGEENTIQVRREIGNKTLLCDFTYTYYVRDSAMIINGLGVVGSNLGFHIVIAPAELDRLSGLYWNLENSKDLTYEKVSALEKGFTLLFDSLKRFNYQLITPGEFSKSLSMYYGDLSWSLLTRKDPKEALRSADRALKLDQDAHHVDSYRALAYLLLNDLLKAKIIYTESELSKEAFLTDIASLEKAGIKHPDLAKAKKLLTENK